MENKKDIEKDKPNGTQEEIKYLDADDFIDRVRDVKNVDELVLLKDEKNGVLVQLNSNRMNVEELLGHATAGYNFILESRKE